MSGEVLRRAASLMRERAETAEPGVWKLWGMQVMADTSGTSNVDLATPVANCYTPSTSERRLHTGNATHVASWHPSVALAVADLLDLAATHEKREGDDAGQGWLPGGYGYVDPSCSQCGTPDEYAERWPCAYATRGLAVARAYLGDTP